MKALQFHMNVPKLALTRALGLFSSAAYTSPIAPVQLRAQARDGALPRPLCLG